MKVLIVGGGGMLGHRLLQTLQDKHRVKTTIRDRRESYERFGLFDDRNTCFGIDGSAPADLARVLTEFRPDVVVNAAGIVKQRDVATLDALDANVMLPHRLDALCRSASAKLIQISTDCVFSGDRGAYNEGDRPDPQDAYGHMKLLGEISAAPHLTLRASMIGTELVRKLGLLEWYLAQRGSIRGYTKAIFSGLTTQELARAIDRIICDHPDLTGLWHVASAPISKFDVLRQLTEQLGRDDIEIRGDDSFTCDRSLDGRRFAARTGYHAPAWNDMLVELAAQIKAEGRLQ